MTLNGRTALYCTNDASFGAHHENLKEGRSRSFCVWGYRLEGSRAAFT